MSKVDTEKFKPNIKKIGKGLLVAGGTIIGIAASVIVANQHKNTDIDGSIETPDNGKKYVVQMKNAYTGEIMDIEDEIFSTYEDAEDYAHECGCNYAAGAETLELAGRDFGDPNDVEFDVVELE